MSLKWFLKTKIKFEDFHGQYKFCLSAITRLDVIQVLLELSVLFLKRASLVVHKHTTGGIPQRLDTESENEHSVVTAVVVTVLRQQYSH